MEARLANFRGKLEALKRSRAKDATLQSVGDMGKLGPEEMDIWDRYAVLLKIVQEQSDEAAKDLKMKIDALIQDLKRTESQVTDKDVKNFYDWMRNRLVGLSSFTEYLDDTEIKKEILVELAIERKELEL